jgi:hypothetical protein
MTKEEAIELVKQDASALQKLESPFRNDVKRILFYVQIIAFKKCWPNTK